MCFNIYWSGGFSLVGLYATWFISHYSSNSMLATGIFYFFLMEFLQVLQYVFIASDLSSPVCDDIVNQVLTIAGFLHICLQPYFLHHMNEALLPPLPANATPEKEKQYARFKGQYAVVKRLCFIGGFLLFLRWPLSYVAGWDTLNGARSTEWLRGHNVCTYKTASMFHLGWSVPMADPTYNIMGTGIHSFLMFAPFLALYEGKFSSMFTKGLVLQGIICYLTGPFMAAMVSDNLQEQASIWCLFSIAQIVLALARIWPTFRKLWGTGHTHHKKH